MVSQTIVVGAVVHEHHVVGDGDGGGGGRSGEQAIVVDNTSGSPTVLYSNARWVAAALGLVAESLAALGWRRGRAAVLRPRQRRWHPVLHVVGQPGGQRARVQLVELDQLQQVVELGRPFVQGVQPAIATLVEDLKERRSTSGYGR